jgi:lipopolysaccharide biosynthesis regulator YciM
LAALDGDDARVEVLLGRLVARDSDDVFAYLALAKLYRGRGEVGRAIGLHQTLALRRDLSPAMRVRALSELAADFRAGGYLRRAIASYEEVLEHDRRDEVALEALAELLPESGEHAQGLVMRRRLARVRGERDYPGESAALLRMAEATLAQKRPDVARRIVKRAIRRDSDNAAAYILLGEIEVARGKRPKALAAWRKALEVGGGAPEIYASLGEVFGLGEHGEEWEALLRERLAAAPGDAEARLALARHRATQGEDDDAVAELRRALDERPDWLAAHLALGRTLLSLGREMDAVKGYAELLALLDDAPESPAASQRSASEEEQ